MTFLFLFSYKQDKAYGGEVPFFEDERMYTVAYVETEIELDTTQLFRLGKVDGYIVDG